MNENVDNYTQALMDEIAEKKELKQEISRMSERIEQLEKSSTQADRLKSFQKMGYLEKVEMARAKPKEYAELVALEQQQAHF